MESIRVLVLLSFFIASSSAFAAKRLDCGALLNAFQERLSAELAVQMDSARANAKLTIYLEVPKHVEENNSTYSNFSANVPLLARLATRHHLELLDVHTTRNGMRSYVTVRGTKKNLVEMFEGFQEREAGGYRELMSAGFGAGKEHVQESRDVKAPGVVSFPTRAYDYSEAIAARVMRILRECGFEVDENYTVVREDRGDIIFLRGNFSEVDFSTAQAKIDGLKAWPAPSSSHSFFRK